jgi:hypothetical protein
MLTSIWSSVEPVAVLEPDSSCEPKLVTISDIDSLLSIYIRCNA